MPGYEWPMITVLHPEFGSYRLHVHGLRPRGSADLTLVVFANGASSVKQAGLVEQVADGIGSEIVQLSEDDISEPLAVFMAAQAHAKPDSGVLIVPGSEWSLDGVGREVVHCAP